MGKVRDKHGRMKWPDEKQDTTSGICGTCGKRVQDMNEHKALFHPEYRNDNTTPLKLVPISPKDKRLKDYEFES